MDEMILVCDVNKLIFILYVYNNLIAMFWRLRSFFMLCCVQAHNQGFLRGEGLEPKLKIVFVQTLFRRLNLVQTSLSDLGDELK